MEYNKYLTITSQDEIDICDIYCPYPKNPEKCGNYGCDFYRNEKAKLLKLKKAREKRERRKRLYELQKAINR